MDSSAALCRSPRPADLSAGAAESRSFAEKPPVCSKSKNSGMKSTKKPRRRVLADLTNSDSPIAGLTPIASSIAASDVGSPVCFSSPGTPATPGIGEDVLRSQVNLLLQQVQAEAPPRGPLFGFRSESMQFAAAVHQQSFSPGMLVGPTPANTPAMSVTPAISISSRSRLSKTSQYHKADEEEDEANEEQQQLPESKLRRTISDISKITIAETVTTSDYRTPLCLKDRFITRSLNFDSLLSKLSAVADEETTP